VDLQLKTALSEIYQRRDITIATIMDNTRGLQYNINDSSSKIKLKFMEVLSYQLFFILIIVLSSLFGRTIRNWVVFISAIFTIFVIFTTGLMVIQLISIIIGFSISESIFSRLGENKENIDDAQGCCGLVFFAAMISAVLYLIFH
jgi:hypothetical protein